MLNQTPHEGTLVIANLNSPLQTVVSGTTSAIEALSAVCASAGLSATQLPVSNAFHSPLVADAGEALSRSARVPMAAAPTACTLISSIDGGVIAGSIDVRRHFGRQIVQSVDFVRATATLAAHCDVAVEVGPGAVLTRLIEQAEPALPLTVCALEEKVESARGLNRVIALAHAHGHRINWSELYTGRVVRPFTPASAKKFIVNPCERAMAVPEPGGTLTSAALAGIGVEGLVGNDTDASPAPAFLADVTEPANEVPVGGELSSALGSLMELAVDLTGFDRETIAPEWSLTDDLNLDSIKVASLVARIEQEYAIQGRIDPATAAQITLGQLAEMVDDLRAAEPAGTDETASPRAGSRWVRSFEMRLVADPQPAVSDVSAFRNRVVGLLCDEKDDAVADAVAGELKALDAEVMRIPTDEDGITSADCEVLIAVLPRRERSPGDDETAVRGQVKRLCRVTAMLKRSPSCRSVLFVQFGGLSTGQDLLAGSLGSAACSSFAASLHHDRPELSVRVLDFAPQVDADDIARITLREHNGKVGYQLHHYDESLTRHSQESRVIEARLAPERDIDWTSDDVILVTGGAKGITAECAFALARATGARMALVGSSPYASGSERTSEIGRTLARYAQAGLAADYFACDVTDPRAVAALVETVKGQLGPVSGIIHGAGVNKPRRAEDVDEHAALAEVSPKLLGIFNLCRALADAPPKLIVGLSSIIGITGMPGNAWYAFSNEALNLFLQRFASAHPGCQVVAAAYSIWDEVGMGARMGSVEHLAHQGISAVPVREGVESFLNLVLRKPSAHQVVIAGRLEGLDTWPKPIPAAPAAQRFLEEVIAFEPGVEVVSRVRLSLTEDLYLRDHFFRGMYLFPTVFGLEAMAESVARVLGRERLDPLVIENISLTRPIVVDETRGAEIEVRALVQERTASEQPERVRVEIACAETGFLASHFAADFVLESPRATVSPAVTPRRPEAALPLEPQSELYGSLLWQGPLFQRLERVWRLDSLGSMSEVAVNRKGRFFASHPSTDLVLGDPAYRDVLLQSAQLSLRGHWLPIGIQAMQIHRIERSSSSTACVQTDFVQENDSRCDVVVTEGFGGPIIETLVSYELKQISEEPQAPTPEDWADPGERDRRIVDELMRRAGEELGAMETACELHFTPNLPPVSDTGGAAAMLPRLQSVAARLH
ncbi:MAG: SDR family NAD(P)-dependent oxidoreductase, partial [Thiohalocapsa sp.]